MALPPSLFEILACPKCRAELTLSADENGLVCESCRILFPIREGIPYLILEEASALGDRRDVTGNVPLAGSRGEPAVFLVVEGKQKGEKIVLERGMCRAVGRSADELEKTKIFGFDPAMALDETSKRLVLQYLSTQFKKKESRAGDENLGGFLRGPDVQIRDVSVSRLHSMIFYDESGAIGILDLVSKNGTFVNGAEVESKLLKKGDLIAFGSTRLRLE